MEGDDLSGLYNECGGHRIQRVPPTERKGRVHTSTVTVAVTDPTIATFTINETDLKIEWYSGTGAGGQHRNKHQNSCRLTHLPSNTVVTAQCRSRQNSLDQARSELGSRLQAATQYQHRSAIASIRKDQVGSGMRGDKIRTYRFQDNQVKDHVTGKVATIHHVMSGGIDRLWE